MVGYKGYKRRSEGSGSVLKGCQKRVIHIKSPQSDFFEEAYLILKNSEEEPSECDIVREAEKLLDASEHRGKSRRFSFGWDEILFFGAGILLSGLFFGILQLFL